MNTPLNNHQNDCAQQGTGVLENTPTRDKQQHPYLRQAKQNHDHLVPRQHERQQSAKCNARQRRQIIRKPEGEESTRFRAETDDEVRDGHHLRNSQLPGHKALHCWVGKPIQEVENRETYGKQHDSYPQDFWNERSQGKEGGFVRVGSRFAVERRADIEHDGG
jgi:hypothetical protein